MTRLSMLSRAATVAVTLGAASAIAGAQAPTKAPPPGPVKPAAIPAFQEAILPNGLRILLVESHRQPVVSLALMLNAGDAYDPAGKEGLASGVAASLTKGAGNRTAEQVSAAIEGVGGSIDAETDEDFMTVHANVLTDNAALAFELTADAVMHPTFAPKEVELVRTQALSGLQLELSNPASLAQRFFAAHLFGAHPYGKRPTTTSVRAITLDDVHSFQHARLVPRGALLVVAGDINLSRARELATKNFGTWSGSAPASVARAKPPTRAATEILLVHRPGSVQSNILAGNLTYPPSNPSYYALTVANRVAGGGSDGRLFKTLREQKSWTYGAYSSLARYHDIGTFQATAEVRNPVTDSALAEMLKIVRGMGTTPVGGTELDAAKGGLVGSLPLALQSAAGIAEQVGRYTMLGLPSDFIRTLRPRLAAVTSAELETAAHQYMRGDQELVVVVGDGAQIYEKLAKIAPTHIVNAQGDAMSPSDLSPRATTLPVDITKLVERSDSFTVMVQGNAFGYQVNTLSKNAGGFSYKTHVAIGPVVQQVGEVMFGSDLSPKSVTISGQAQGIPVTANITYANGRVKGSSSTPGAAGIKNVTVDTTIAPGVLDDNMIAGILPGLRWAADSKYTFNAFDPVAGVMRHMSLSVAGTESVTVPAGTFPVYRVDYTGQDQALTLFVTTAAPHRVVKIALAGQPVEFQLVK